MVETIKLNQIHDKHLNFLIGAGASVGLFPTLTLKIKDVFGEKHTVETLATLLEDDKKKYTALFMHYYLGCIKPVAEFSISSIRANPHKQQVISNYEKFLRTILSILRRKNDFPKKANIFTTNYDGCFAFAGDRILRKKTFDFILNDGTSGFFKRTLQAHNFNKTTNQSGIFERAQTSIPQLNLIHAHGSAYWLSNGNNIQVDYSQKHVPIITSGISNKIKDFRQVIEDDASTDSDLPTPKLSASDISDFWVAYKKLPIVNPTKWKFYETLFDEHYYQMLRMLSYELERPNSILITFGFSFADEHILSLVKRSLVNPTLKVYVCCYDEKSATALATEFNEYPNVEIIKPDSDETINFSKFNADIFTLDEGSAKSTEAL